jgi:DNA-binding HxlR family transcriptional regulator
VKSLRKTYKNLTDNNCPTANTMAIIGGKWKVVLLLRLYSQDRHFNELQNLLGDITPHTLNKELRELMEDGLVVKEIISIDPLKTSYKVTDKALELKESLLMIQEFGKRHSINQ